ncbi:UNVERIFIED_CONTAM: hypothetical protein PYX00_004865 [Menopon gallinae]|uniref:Phosphodiesterase n=1 Tax=Menopon gallinae TaxID=328185 RepID=A0AAW2I7G7_9NEOP
MEASAEPSEPSRLRTSPTARENAAAKEDHQKKKKLVYFEIDGPKHAQDFYEACNFKIEELFRTSSEVNDDDGFARVSPFNCKSTSKPRQLVSEAGNMIFDELGIDIIELQNRILELEKHLKNEKLSLPPHLSDLKSKVENFRNKLETVEHINRTEFGREPLCQRYQYRRTSNERGRKVREKFLQICDMEIGQATKDWLKQPTFDSSQWKDEEILLFLQQMFLELDLTNRFSIRLPILRNFLYEVYKNYNEVPFHNFRHCFCVAQMMYVIAWSVDIPGKMGHLDTLILLTSCICHDLDHPGYNNIYQINARTELALRYNDISPLENHHCSVAFRILENPECNIFAALDKETFKEVREGIIRCILATDMARHNEILTQFKEVTPCFDFGNKAHKNLLSMILIKVADISNEARPMSVAEPWLDRLLMEFFKQSDAEKQEGLPVTPFMDRDKITKPSSQCSFIGFVLLPLFEALGELLPELHELIITPAKEALEHYRKLNEAAKDERMRRKSVVECCQSESGEESESAGMVKSGSGHSMRGKRNLSGSSLQGRQRSKSEDLDGEGTPPSSPGGLSGLVQDFEDIDEGEEDYENVEAVKEELEEEEETVTEVEVSEKTVKFKISTESSTNNFSGRKSCPGSRKGSRERNQYSDNDGEWTRMSRDEESRSFKRSVTSETMSSQKGSLDSETGSVDSARGDDRRRLSRDEECRRKSCQNKKEYRRKSLAVVERVHQKECGKSRRSVPNCQESDGKRSDDVERAIDDELLDKLSNNRNENRYSREFETSCWGLQNLKKGTTVFNKNPIVINANKTYKNSAEKKLESEKSKSEDNLTIKGSGRLECSSVLGNNINISKTDDSIERQLAGELGKRKKPGAGAHSSILAKLKNLKDKMSCKREQPEANSELENSVPGSLKGGGGGGGGDNQCEDEHEKSRTLPKTKRPLRASGRVKKGWRALIGKSDGNSSTSLEFIPPTTGSPSPIHANRKSSSEEIKSKSKSVDSSSNGDKRRTIWMASPKKSGFVLRMNRSEESTFLNSLASSFRKRRNRTELEENVASSSTSM